MNNFLSIILFVFISLISYNLLKIFVLSNIKVNKWIILILFLLVIGASFFVNLPLFVMYIIQWLYFILILWFIDIFMDECREKIKNKNKKVIQNRPKPKPNRAKMNKKV